MGDGDQQHQHRAADARAHVHGLLVGARRRARRRRVEAAAELVLASPLAAVARCAHGRALLSNLGGAALVVSHSSAEGWSRASPSSTPCRARTTPARRSPSHSRGAPHAGCPSRPHPHERFSTKMGHTIAAGEPLKLKIKVAVPKPEDQLYVAMPPGVAAARALLRPPLRRAAS